MSNTLDVIFCLKLNCNHINEVTEDTIKHLIENRIVGIKVEKFNKLVEEKDKIKAEIESNLHEILMIHNKFALTVNERFNHINRELINNLKLLEQKLEGQNLDDKEVYNHIKILNTLAEVNYKLVCNPNSKGSVDEVFKNEIELEEEKAGVCKNTDVRESALESFVKITEEMSLLRQSNELLDIKIKNNTDESHKANLEHIVKRVQEHINKNIVDINTQIDLITYKLKALYMKVEEEQKKNNESKQVKQTTIDYKLKELYNTFSNCIKKCYFDIESHLNNTSYKRINGSFTKLDKLRDEVYKFEHNFKQQKEKANKLNATIEELKNTNEIYKTKLKTLKEYLDSTQEQFNTAIRTYETTFKSEYKKLYNFMLGKAQTIISTAQTSLSLMNKEVISKLVNKLNDTNIQLKERMEQQQTLITKSKENLELAKKEVDEKNKEIVKLRSELRMSKENTVKELTQMKSLKRVKVKDLALKGIEEFKQLIILGLTKNKKLDRIHNLVMILKEKLMELKKHNIKTEEENVHMQHELSTLKEELNIIKGKEEIVNKEMPILTEKLNVSVKKVKEINEELVTKDTELKITKKKLEIVEKQLSDQSNMKHKLRRMIEESKKLTESIDHIKELNTKIGEQRLKLEDIEDNFKNNTEELVTVIKNIEDNKQVFKLSTASSLIIDINNSFEGDYLLDDISSLLDNLVRDIEGENKEDLINEIKKIQDRVQSLNSNQIILQKKYKEETERAKELEELLNLLSEEYKNSLTILRTEFLKIKKVVDNNKNIPKDIKKYLLQPYNIKALLLNIKDNIKTKANHIPTSLIALIAKAKEVINKVKGLHQKVTKLKVQFKKVKEDRVKLKKSNVSISKLLKDKERLLEELKEDYVIKENEVGALLGKLKITEEKKKKMQQIAEATSGNNIKLSKIIETNQKEITRLNKLIGSLEDSNRKLDQSVQMKDKELEKQNNNGRKEMEELIRKFEKIISSKEENIVALRKKYKEDISKYETDNSDLEQELNKLIIKHGKTTLEYKGQIEELILQIKTQELQLNKLQNSLERRDEEIEILKEKDNNVLIAKDVVSDKLAILSQEYERYKENTKENIEELMATNKLLKDGLEQQLNNGRPEISQLKTIQTFIKVYRTEIKGISRVIETFGLSIFFNIIVKNIAKKDKEFIEKNSSLTYLCKTFITVENKRQEIYNNKITKLEALKLILEELIQGKESAITKCIEYFPYLKAKDPSVIIKVIEYKQKKLESYYDEKKNSLTRLEILHKTIKSHST